MNTKIISPEQAKDMILATKGKFFTVKFIKKSNGELRTMNCTLNMKSKLKGGESTINKDYQIPVIDTAEAASKFPFRSFDINTLKVLKVNKQSYQVDGAVVL